MRPFLTLLAGIVLSVVAPSAAQSPGEGTTPAAQLTDEQLEEEHIRSRIENGDSHASGARPELGPIVLGNPTTAVDMMRVGLHASSFNATGGLTSEFGSLHHTAVELTNTDGDVRVIDRATGHQIAVMAPGSVIRVQHDGLAFLVTQDEILVGHVAGPVLFRPTSRANLFRAESIRRSFGGIKIPLYRGAMEVGRGPSTPAARVNLINVLDVESYVAGVVANESIASFSREALKAQAVAVRGYAIANIGNFVRRGFSFDLVDSSSSQVYRGVISEHPNAVRATTDTRGLVASSNGRVVSTVYSSSFGGHSEDNEWISFSFRRAMGGLPESHTRGIYDGDEPAPDLSTSSGIDAFWRAQPPVPRINDECSWTGNSFSRWSFPLPASVIKARLTTTGSNPNAVFVSGSSLSGAITDVAITERGAASKRAASVRITLQDPDAVVEVRGWEGIRRVVGRTASPSNGLRACSTNPTRPPSALPNGFVLNSPSSLDVERNADGTVRSVMVYGGGWGHNLGLSQWGAHGRGKSGQLFIDILQAYYTGVDIGSHPIDIGRDPGTGPPTLRQEFVAPNALGTLEIRSTDLQGLRVHFNELHDLSFDAATLAAGVVRVDVSPYLVPGVNVVQYNPVGRSGTATVSVVVR